jgi:hypothetical protein
VKEREREKERDGLTERERESKRGCRTGNLELKVKRKRRCCEVVKPKLKTKKKIIIYK